MRPERAPESVLAQGGLWPESLFLAVSDCGKGQHFRPPLSGRVIVAGYPGLKPWAIMLDHFMVRNRVNATFLPITSHESPFDARQP